MAVADDLAGRGADLFRTFGWPGAPGDAPPPADLGAIAGALPLFSDVVLPPGGTGDGGAAARITAFAEALTPELLARAGLSEDERAVLVCSLRHRLGLRLAVIEAGSSAYYHYQVFKRTRRLADLRRVDPAYLGRIVLAKLKRLTG